METEEWNLACKRDKKYQTEGREGLILVFH